MREIGALIATPKTVLLDFSAATCKTDQLVASRCGKTGGGMPTVALEGGPNYTVEFSLSKSLLMHSEAETLRRLRETVQVCVGSAVVV